VALPLSHYRIHYKNLTTLLLFFILFNVYQSFLLKAGNKFHKPVPKAGNKPMFWKNIKIHKDNENRPA